MQEVTQNRAEALRGVTTDTDPCAERGQGVCTGAEPPTDRPLQVTEVAPRGNAHWFCTNKFRGFGGPPWLCRTLRCLKRHGVRTIPFAGWLACAATSCVLETTCHPRVDPSTRGRRDNDREVPTVPSGSPGWRPARSSQCRWHSTGKRDPPDVRDIPVTTTEYFSDAAPATPSAHGSLFRPRPDALRYWCVCLRAYKTHGGHRAVPGPLLRGHVSPGVSSRDTLPPVPTVRAPGPPLSSCHPFCCIGPAHGTPHK